MSIKTSKRIALGVIASLVFAPFAAIAPASAAITTLAGLTAPVVTQDSHGIIRAASNGTALLTFSSVVGVASDSIAVRVDSVPAGATASTVEVGDVFADVLDAQGDDTAITIGAPKSSVTPGACQAQLVNVTDGTWTRSGSVLTITKANHGLSVGAVITTTAAWTWTEADLSDNDGPGNNDDDVYTLVPSGTQFVVSSVASGSFTVSVAGSDTVIINPTPAVDGDVIAISAAAYNTTAYTWDPISGGSIQNDSTHDQVFNAVGSDPLVVTQTEVCNGVIKNKNGTYSDDYLNVAGTYTFTVWYDDPSTASGRTALAGVKQADENIERKLTIVVSGAPTDITITPALTMQASDTVNGYDNPVWIYLKDTAGNATKLVSGESMTVAVAGASGDGTFSVGANRTATASSITITHTGTGAIGSVVGADTATFATYYETSVRRSGTMTVQGSSVTYKVTLGGSLPATTTASSVLVFANDSAADSVSIKAGTKGVTTTADAKYKFPAARTSGVATIAANPLQAQSITYVVEGTPGRYVNVTVDDLAGTRARLGTGVMPAGLANLVRPVLIGVDGTAEFTVAATAAAEINSTSDSYTISASGKGYDTVYNAATVNSSTIVIDELPANVTKMLTPIGGTSTFNLTVADEYDGRYSGFTVRLSTATLQRNASKTVDALTAADGKARVSLTDAGTTTSVAATSTTLDSIKLSVFVPNNTATDLLNRSVSVFYGANTGGSMDLYGGTTSTQEWQVYVAAATGDLDDGNGTLGGRDDAGVPGLAVLRTSTGAPESGYAMKVTAVTPGVKFLSDVLNNGMSTRNDYFDDAVDVLHVPADGTIRFYALASKVGVNTVKVELGGFSKEMSFTAFTHTDFARNLVWTPATIAAVGTSPVVGSSVELAVTVQDGFGNGVAGVSPTFTVLNGRSLSGASGAVVPTGSNGVASLQVTRDTAGVMSAEVTLTSGQTALLANDPVTGWAAPIKKLTTPNVTFQAAPEPAPVYEKPTLTIRKTDGRVILSGTAENGEGDIIVYVKKVGSTTWKERARTFEVSAPGDFNGTIKAPKNDVVIRVKQEGTGLFSNQVIVKK